MTDLDILSMQKRVLLRADNIAYNPLDHSFMFHGFPSRSGSNPQLHIRRPSYYCNEPPRRVIRWLKTCPTSTWRHTFWRILTINVVETEYKLNISDRKGPRKECLNLLGRKKRLHSCYWSRLNANKAFVKQDDTRNNLNINILTWKKGEKYGFFTRESE